MKVAVSATAPRMLESTMEPELAPAMSVTWSRNAHHFGPSPSLASTILDMMTPGWDRESGVALHVVAHMLRPAPFLFELIFHRCATRNLACLVPSTVQGGGEAAQFLQVSSIFLGQTYCERFHRCAEVMTFLLVAQDPVRNDHPRVGVGSKATIPSCAEVMTGSSLR